MFQEWVPTLIKFFIRSRKSIGLHFNIKVFKKFIESKLARTPISIMIEPACKCNLKCPLCTTPHKYMTRKQGIMEWNTYQKIVNDVKDFALIFYYNFAGEPFLNQKLFQMVNEAGKHDIITLVDTNATLFTKKRIREILNSELNILVVNIDYREKGELRTP